jgi:hypothetical protein
MMGVAIGTPQFMSQRVDLAELVRFVDLDRLTRNIRYPEVGAASVGLDLSKVGATCPPGVRQADLRLQLRRPATEIRTGGRKGHKDRSELLSEEDNRHGPSLDYMNLCPASSAWPAPAGVAHPPHVNSPSPTHTSVNSLRNIVRSFLFVVRGSRSRFRLAKRW